MIWEVDWQLEKRQERRDASFEPGRLLWILSGFLEGLREVE